MQIGQSLIAEQKTTTHQSIGLVQPAFAKNEKQLTQQYLDFDIAGLTIVQASAKYITKFNTIREHFEKPDHPIGKVIEAFREKLVIFLREKQASIQQISDFYENESGVTFITE